MGDFTINPFDTKDWIFDTKTMSYTGTCSVRKVYFNILWDDLYSAALAGQTFNGFLVAVNSLELFKVSYLGGGLINISQNNMDGIILDFWNKYTAFTGA